MTKKKILFVIPSLAKGGQEKAGMVLCNYLENIYDLKIVCFETPNELDFPYLSEVERIEIPVAQSSVGKALVVGRRVKELRKIKSRFKPDVSIAFGETACLANTLTFTSEKKISTIQQSTEALLSGNSWWRCSLLKSIYKIIVAFSSKLVSVSEKNSLYLKSFFNTNKSLSIPNAIDIRSIKERSEVEIESRLKSFFKGYVLCHSGRFHWQKGHWHLARIFCLLRERQPGFKLLLLGSIDESNSSQGVEIYKTCLSLFEKAGLKVFELGRTEDSNLEDFDVLVLGHQTNPFKYVSRADLFVFPSLWEGFPSVLIEALACAVPVVSADCISGPNEIIGDDNDSRKCGFLVKPFQIKYNIDEKEDEHYDLWIHAILSFYDKRLDAGKQHSLSRASLFSIEVTGKKWEELIESL